MDAIRMFTINAAYLEFEEGEKGSIEPGKIADMAVLSEDPLTVSHEMLKEIKVDMTIIDGKVAYTRKSE
jgi:predicted amidohydrolase YtcJ